MRQAAVAGILCFGLLAAACGSDGDEAGDIEAPVCASGQIDGDLTFTLFIWEDYIPADLITLFERKYGVTVELHTYTSNASMLSKIQAQAAPYDVAVPSDYMVDIMRKDGLLLPLDPIALPSRTNIDPLFVSGPPYEQGRPFDPGDVYSVPYLWGTIGIGVNRNVVGQDLDASWALIFDPEISAQYAGRISLLDDYRQSLGAALIYLGHSPNTLKREEVQAAADLIAGVVDSLAGFDSEGYAEDLADGALDVAQGRSDVFIDSFGTASTDYQFIIPDEGAIAWVDNMVIPTTAAHPCTAHSFIDFILEERNGASLANYTGYATPNTSSFEFIDESILNDPALYPPERSRETLEFLVDIGDSDVMYVDEFSRGQGS